MHDLYDPSTVSVAQQLAHLSDEILEEHLEICFGLWQNAASLEVFDSKFYQVLDMAYSILLEASAVQQQQQAVY